MSELNFPAKFGGGKDSIFKTNFSYCLNTYLKTYLSAGLIGLTILNILCTLHLQVEYSYVLENRIVLGDKTKSHQDLGWGMGELGGLFSLHNNIC